APIVSYQIAPPSPEICAEHDLDAGFYKKCVVVHDIAVVGTDKLMDHTLLETAYLFDKMMSSIAPDVAQRIRDRKVLCILAGIDELTSDFKTFKTNKTGKELDFYNWRKRGFLAWPKRRPVVFFAEEDVLELKGGSSKESILIHEFGHVVHLVGCDKDQRTRITAAYKNAMAKKLWHDGSATQYYWARNEEPISILDSLVEHFPGESLELLKKCIKAGDILVNYKPVELKTTVQKKDRVSIHFGGEKACYAASNENEYFAEGFQTWYDTNRVMDHDHNHIDTRRELIKYDPDLAAICKELQGDSKWRFISPKKRVGKGHLAHFDPATAPEKTTLPHIREAADKHFLDYWKPYWERLRSKHQ
ncbi:MAG: hypothetical protein ACI8W8_001956, partial [Rhodothermales bacterium]